MIENKYKYYIRLTKGAYVTKAGYNQSLEDIEKVLTWRNPFLEVLEKKVGKKRYLKVYEIYDGQVILNKNEWDIKNKFK